jgi:hypothetical protein
MLFLAYSMFKAQGVVESNMEKFQEDILKEIPIH